MTDNGIECDYLEPIQNSLCPLCILFCLCGKICLVENLIYRLTHDDFEFPIKFCMTGWILPLCTRWQNNLCRVRKGNYIHEIHHFRNHGKESRLPAARPHVNIAPDERTDDLTGRGCSFCGDCSLGYFDLRSESRHSAFVGRQALNSAEYSKIYALVSA